MIIQVNRLITALRWHFRLIFKKHPFIEFIDGADIDYGEGRNRAVLRFFGLRNGVREFKLTFYDNRWTDHGKDVAARQLYYWLFDKSRVGRMFIRLHRRITSFLSRTQQ